MKDKLVVRKQMLDENSDETLLEYGVLIACARRPNGIIEVSTDLGSQTLFLSFSLPELVAIALEATEEPDE